MYFSGKIGQFIICVAIWHKMSLVLQKTNYMGVDCSMILKCEFHDERDHRKKVEYMRAFIDRMVEECRIAFKKNIVELVDEENYCFWFTPFDLVSTNLYDGFWECESAWRFTQYVYWGFARRLFFDIAQYFGVNEAYICEETLAYDGGIQEGDTYETWLADKESRYGPIPEYDPAVTPYVHLEQVSPIYHDCFIDLHKDKERLKTIARSMGMESAGVARYGDRYYFFRKGNDIYLYDDISGGLYSETPIEYYKIIDETTDMIAQNGEEKILHRKPAFADTFTLVNDLQYAPE